MTAVSLLHAGYEGVLAVLRISGDPARYRKGHDGGVSHLRVEGHLLAVMTAADSGEHLEAAVLSIGPLVWRRDDVPGNCSKHTIPPSPIAFSLSSVPPSWSSPPAA